MDELEQAYREIRDDIDNRFGTISNEAGEPHKIKMGGMVQYGLQKLEELYKEEGTSVDELKACANSMIEGINAHNEAAGMDISANSPGMRNEKMMDRAIDLNEARTNMGVNIDSACSGPKL